MYMDAYLPKDLLPPVCRKIGIKVLIVRRQTDDSKGTYLSNMGALCDALDVRWLVDNLNVFLSDGSSHSCKEPAFFDSFKKTNSEEKILTDSPERKMNI